MRYVQKNYKTTGRTPRYRVIDTVRDYWMCVYFVQRLTIFRFHFGLSRTGNTVSTVVHPLPAILTLPKLKTLGFCTKPHDSHTASSLETLVSDWFLTSCTVSLVTDLAISDPMLDLAISEPFFRDLFSRPQRVAHSNCTLWDCPCTLGLDDVNILCSAVIQWFHSFFDWIGSSMACTNWLG